MTAVVIGVRWAWIYTTPYLIRLLDRRPEQRLRRVGARQRTVSAVAGFRGAVSLAAVLAVPHTLDSGAPFPDRDLIVLITCGVIVLTLLQALLLPAVVRFARLPVDNSVAEELQLAEVFTLDAAIEAIDPTAAELGSGEPVVERVRHELDKQRKLLAAAGADGDPVVQHDDQYTSLSLALIARRREALLELRDEQRIDDIVLRRVQARLDIEEVRISCGPTSSTERGLESYREGRDASVGPSHGDHGDVVLHALVTESCGDDAAADRLRILIAPNARHTRSRRCRHPSSCPDIVPRRSTSPSV